MARGTSAAARTSGDCVRELEDHLDESVPGLKSRGLNEEDHFGNFISSRHRFGDFGRQVPISAYAYSGSV